MKVGASAFLCVCSIHFTGLLWAADDAAALLRDADRYADAGNWIAARDLYAKAQQAFHESGDERNELYAKFGRLHRDVEAGSYSVALQEVETDLAKPVVQGDPLLKIRALSLKGTIDLNLNTAAARDDFTQIAEVAKSIGDQKWQNRAAGELGVVAGANGDIGRAGLALLAAINKAAEIHDLAGQMTFSVWLANGMTVNGMADRALRVLDKATEAASQNPASGIPIQLQIARIRALMNLPAGPQRDAGVEQAQHLIQDSLAAAMKSDTLGAQAELLNEAGSIAQHKPDLAAAAHYFNDAAAVADRADLPRMRAAALHSLCEVYKTQGKLTEANTAIDSAIAQLVKAQEPIDFPLYIAEKAEVEVGLRHFAEASDLYTRATALAESLLINAPSSHVKSAMIDTMAGIYLGHFRLALLTMHDPAKAFEIVENARGRSLADSMRSHNSSKSPLLQSALDSDLAKIQSELRKPSNTPAETRRLLARLDRTYDALAPVEYARDRAEVTALLMPASLAAVRRVLHPNEALIEYVLGAGEHSYAFEITAAQVHVHTLPPREQLEKLAQAYAKAVRSKEDSTKLARILFDTAVAPAISTKPNSVVIIPDGSLHLVPFASLRDDTGQYWVKSVQIASAPSATVFQRLRTAHTSGTRPRPFLGLAYSPGDSGAVIGKTAVTRAASFGDHALDLKPLPYAEDEVAAAAQVLGKGSVVLTGAGASETALKSQPLSEFEIIHVAAHGVSDLVEPDRAGLVLAPETGPEDGFWQAREIRRSNLAADLVTLSACETGSGRLQGEEGIMNLARSFLVAGAGSIVASLWDADDRTTATLMSHFYKHIASGSTVAESLQAAQQEMLAEFGEDTKPYFWSGFTVIGDGTRKIVQQTHAAQSGTAHQNLR